VNKKASQNVTHQNRNNMQFYPIKTKNDQLFYVMPRPQGEKIYAEIAEMQAMNIDTDFIF
jgi:hypothetical protein